MVDFWRLPLSLDGVAVKKDSEGGVHPWRFSASSVCYARFELFGSPNGELRNSARCAHSITAFHFFALFAFFAA